MAEKWYKVLKNGRSFSDGRWKWDLPAGDEPGAWQDVGEGPLKFHEHGFHITSGPMKYYNRKKPDVFQCYEVEFEGDFLLDNFSSDHAVVRRCRLLSHVPWSEWGLDEASPAMRLLYAAWSATQDASWRVINETMQVATRLAVTSGMRFAVGDFKEIEDAFSSVYWIDHEYMYSRSISGSHGPNGSAIKALEHHLDRKPFIVVVRSDDTSKTRLHQGSQFYWHEDLKEEIRVKVTSFSTKKVKSKDAAGKAVESEVPCVVACSYVESMIGTGTQWERVDEKVNRVFKISHQDIADYHGAIRDARKAGKKKGGPDAEEAA